MTHGNERDNVIQGTFGKKPEPKPAPASPSGKQEVTLANVAAQLSQMLGIPVPIEEAARLNYAINSLAQNAFQDGYSKGYQDGIQKDTDDEA